MYNFGSRFSEEIKSPQLRKEIVRTLIVFTLFALVVITMMLAQIASDRLFDQYVKRVIKRNPGVAKLSIPDGEEYAIEPLHDLLFTILPDWSNMRSWLPDILLSPLIAIGFIFSVFLARNRRIPYQGFVVMRRILFIVSSLYIFRTITFFMTTVPSPMNGCSPIYVRDHDLTNYLILIGRMASGKVTACTDNIYSGHTTLITVMVLSLVHYSGTMLIRVYAVFHGLAAIFSILITRLHYSVDVIIALLLASFVYLGYHCMITIYIDTCVLRDKQIIDTHVNIYEERRLLMRIISFPILKMLSWIDGLDIRNP